jgi:1-phosphofructokinase family hexose kinase
MFLCITPNAAVDRTLVVPGFSPGKVHRTASLLVAAGGKGLNVARAIRLLDGQAVCCGFVGGDSGRMLEHLAANEGLEAAWTRIEGETRTCTIIVDTEEGEVSVINEQGPQVSEADWDQLRATVMQQAQRADGICASGSLPPGSPAHAFEGFIYDLHETGKPLWVDTSGNALRAALTIQGVHIKVNNDEAAWAAGYEVRNVEGAVKAAQLFRSQGAAVVAVTMGGLGALLSSEKGCWFAQSPPVNVVSAVGSGDAFLAGLITALANGKSESEGLAQAVAAGAANAMKVGGGRFERADFDEILARTQVEAVG